MKSEHPNLTQQKCLPCEGIGKPLNRDQVDTLLRNIPDWRLGQAGKSIFIELTLKNFMAAIALINQIAQIAESENHHPDLHLTGYKRLRIDLTTHALGGLSQNDFIVAAKIDQLCSAPQR